MKKRTIYIIYISIFVLCFSFSFVVYQLFIKKDLSSNPSRLHVADNVDANEYGLANTVQDGVILQAWCWSFNTIKENMADIAYAGFTSVQTSPINACVVGGNGGMQLNGEGKWWYHYQPTDWTIGNYQFGTRDEFKAMCEEADKYGIKVIVDVVPNHTGPTETVLDGLKNAVGGITALYHSTGNITITNYGNRLQCTMYAMDGLVDVNTENEAFQDYFISFLNDCIACGADGFRYDTAKHIALPDDPVQNGNQNNFWTRVIPGTKKADTIFNYGEVLQGDNERLPEYAEKIGHVTASSFGSKLRTAVHSGLLNAPSMINYAVGSLDSSKLVTWFESHDNYINDGSFKFSDDEVVTGWAIIAATGNTTPLFYSRPYGNTSTNWFGTLNRIGLAGNNTFKDDRVAAINHFHNATIGEKCTVTNLDKALKVLCIERGSKGCVLINTASTAYKVNSAIGIADGSYTDQVANEAVFNVSGGLLTGEIPAESIVVLCNDKAFVKLDKPAILDVENANFVFYEDSQDITLTATGAKSSTYQIGDGEEIDYTSGTQISVGEGVSSGDSFDLILRGTNNSDQLSTRRFTFVKKSTISVGTKIYFKAPSSWKTPVYAYAYDETTSVTKKNAEWPGVEMVKESNGLYSYVFTEPWTTALVIFNDGTNQLPASMEPGFEVISQKTYSEEEK